ncbi:MAG TPA: hypothetical protein VFU13_11650 [Steroidobacteraceae bacterium]|nr:hypothetical protein [Steroidobacteraceae bacterium]
MAKLITWGVTLGLVTVPVLGQAPIEQYLIADRNAEVALARSAAPAAISRDATVLVLTRRGYETAMTGKNGFVCLVDRAWQSMVADADFWNPKVRAPVCLNPQATRSVLPIHRKRTEWALAGLAKSEIATRMRAAIGAKELPLPDTGSMSYMMSKEQYLGDQDPHWRPHLMFYIPSTVRGADWGANLPASPVVATPDQLPDGTRDPVIVFMVPAGEWSDGTPAGAHRSN